MTREEMDFIGGMNMCDEISNEAYKKIMCHCEEQEPKTGHWKRDEDWSHHCDVCGAKAPWSWTDGDGFDRMVTPYCPQCGAEMEKWEDTDEEWYVHRDEVYGKGK